MRPSNENASIPESLPADLHAMLKLNEDALTSSWKQESHFYFIALMLGGFFFFIGWDSIGKSATPAPVVYPFFALGLFLPLALHRFAERRAQHRLQLILQVIRGLQRRETASPSA